MPIKKINDFIINCQIDVRRAMKKLDDSHRKILFVVHKNQSLYGSLSDGDIRRWILKGKNLDSSVEKVCNTDPIFCTSDYVLSDVKKVMLKNRIQALPVLDDKNNILELLFWDQIFDTEQHFKIKESLNIPVVIMAGGSGSRLSPFTKILPKPLIPIGDQSILEVIIDKFREYSIDEYYISVYHKANMIKAYLDELNPPYSIKYLEEKKPLGTIGVLSELKSTVDESVICTNCDTIINCNYKDMVEFHDKKKYDITLVGSMINYSIPYGVCEIENEGKLVSLKEKPEHSYLVSTGMYVLRKTALKLIPRNKYFDVTELIARVRNSGGKIGVYPISEKSWLDTGDWQEYKKTVNQLTL